MTNKLEMNNSSLLFLQILNLRPFATKGAKLLKMNLKVENFYHIA